MPTSTPSQFDQKQHQTPPPHHRQRSSQNHHQHPPLDHDSVPLQPSQHHHHQVDVSGFEEVAALNRSRTATISIALPSSILANAQSPELRMYLAGQVARAAAIYCIDEIIIFSEHDQQQQQTRPSLQPSRHRSQQQQQQQQRHKQYESSDDLTNFFATVLDYLDTPQYLRKHLFPVSSELRLVGLLNPLALPSHVSRTDTPRYREGVILPTRSSSSSHHQQQSHPQQQQPPSRYVDVGLDRPVEIDRVLPPGTRVTVDMSLSGSKYDRAPGKYFFGRLVSRDTPRSEAGMYWGYRVRTASALSGVFSGSSLASRGYDLTIGTSERGTHISSSGRPSQSFALPDFSHLLIVFGGVNGLERSVIGDEKLSELGILQLEDEHDNYNNHHNGQQPNGNGTTTPSSGQYDSSGGSSGCGGGAGDSNVGDLFDFYLNTCPQQGSRTIRTEEAILISLAALQPFLNAAEG